MLFHTPNLHNTKKKTPKKKTHNSNTHTHKRKSHQLHKFQSCPNFPVPQLHLFSPTSTSSRMHLYGMPASPPFSIAISTFHRRALDTNPSLLYSQACTSTKFPSSPCYGPPTHLYYIVTQYLFMYFSTPSFLPLYFQLTKRHLSQTYKTAWKPTAIPIPLLTK